MADVVIEGGQLARFQELIPEHHPRPSKGNLSGRFKLGGTGSDISEADGHLSVSGLSFSDKSGLHAAEKLAGSLTFSATRVAGALEWRARLDWDNGEFFWAPLYFPSGGHHVDLRGKLAGDLLQVKQGTIDLAGVGISQFSLEWNLNEGLNAFNADGAKLDGGQFYSLLLKPFLEKTAFDQLTVTGKLDVGFTYARKTVQRFNLAFADITLIDTRGRFSFEKLNATIPWQLDGESKANIRFGAAKLLGIPLGTFEIPVKMHAYSFEVDEVAIPLLDGKLLMKDLAASKEKDDWRWQFSGVLLPVSMEETTKALGGPIMRGMLSATVPLVTYERGAVNVNGGIGIRVFDGDIAITQLRLIEPLGRAPRFYGNVEMRNLDLGLVTSTFKFGSMDGRIDVDVNDLELSNWKPVKLNARVESSPGDYRKRISQQAVQNISALGGAGAAAAIQRSFLRFFEEFGYEKIGLSCRLRNNTCEMSGVESTPQGYVIVKGGGIPAITVKGYNRYVGWNELLERLSRITQGNARPVIK